MDHTERKATTVDISRATRVATSVVSHKDPVPVMCTAHPAFEADNCPGCGTQAKI